MPAEATMILNLTFLGTLAVAGLLFGMILFAGFIALCGLGVVNVAATGVRRLFGPRSTATDSRLADLNGKQQLRHTTSTGMQRQVEAAPRVITQVPLPEVSTPQGAVSAMQAGSGSGAVYPEVPVAAGDRPAEKAAQSAA